MSYSTTNSTHKRGAATLVARSRNSWGPMSTPTTTTTATATFHRLEPDEDYAEEYTERMMGAQMRQLDPLKEDLAEWLNKTLDIDYINRDNFLSELDNGVVLCHLAQFIQESAKFAIEKGLIKEPPPIVRGKCFEKAMRRSFFSRDNMENFIKFCRSLGVHENLLFESDDLVLHNQPRNVILCLLEVARIATKYGVEPPGLVQLEKEIAEEERNQSADSGLSSLLSWQFQASSPPPRMEHEPKMRLSNSASAISSLTTPRWPTGPHSHLVLVTPDPSAGGDTSSINRHTPKTPVNHHHHHQHAHHHHVTSTPLLPTITAASGGASDGVPSDNNTEEDEEWSRGSGEDPDLDLYEEEEELLVRRRIRDGATSRNAVGGGGDATSVATVVATSQVNTSASGATAVVTGSTAPVTELDRKVQQATRLMQRNCQCTNSDKCSKLKVKKVSEGKYNIAGRNVFVRLLKGRHMMVRVGGGWDTLDHFLLRHDPCQVKVVSRLMSNINSSSNSNSSEHSSHFQFNSSNNTHHSETPNSSKYLHIRAKYRSPPPQR